MMTMSSTIGKQSLLIDVVLLAPDPVSELILALEAFKGTDGISYKIQASTGVCRSISVGCIVATSLESLQFFQQRKN